MNRMPVWKQIAEKDNAGFATVLWTALGLGAAAAVLEWGDAPAFAQVLAEAAQTAARLLA